MVYLSYGDHRNLLGYVATNLDSSISKKKGKEKKAKNGQLIALCQGDLPCEASMALRFYFKYLSDQYL